MPVTLADNSAHSKTTPEAKWALVKDKAHATLFTARQHPKRNGLPSKTVKAQKTSFTGSHILPQDERPWERG